MQGRDCQKARDAMVRRQIEQRGIADPRLLAAMRNVPRERFVPAAIRARAFDDCAHAIGAGQTISQPYIVALMVEAARISPGHRVLEVGSGSGYVAAILAEMSAEVVAIEIKPSLANAARDRLAKLGYASVDMRCGDGRKGAPDKTPFDAVLVSATGKGPPDRLVRQLAEGGRLVMPVRHGRGEVLTRFVKTGSELEAQPLCAVRFVPLV